ncbi:4838_t:CDS:1 [Acaulospora morrowiae]|uniref:4838_t:CDS:1 n=1 Tax=Acaulospora morrowiae TaxID=94023 RepID=A0A9N8VK36_9GLOM|nr:4838_t:CDS:1 [Acaulospora morrowiae]
MASVLPSLCIREILLDLRGEWAALHACILINRHWCIFSIQELWRDPFSLCRDRAEKSRHIQLISTYVKCLPPTCQEVNDAVATTTPCAFNYFQFLSRLSTEEVLFSTRFWTKAAFDGQNKTEDTLFKVLCQQFITHSNIESVHLSRIINIFELPGTETSLARVQRFEYDGYLPELLDSAAKISRDIRQFRLFLDDDCDEMNFAAQLIRSQRKVQKISLGCCEMRFHTLWESIAMHAETMVSLRLSSIKFEKQQPFSLNALDNFRNLEELGFDYCNNFTVTINEFNLSSFTKINKLSVTACKRFPAEFLIYVTRQSKERMRQVELMCVGHFREVVESCMRNCQRITKFKASIDTSQSQHVIDLLKNCETVEDVHLNDTRLMKNWLPSRFLIPPAIDGNEFLKELGKVMPSTVHTFRYNLNWDFSPESLKEFFDNWRIKKLNVLDFNLCNFISDEHLEVVCQCLGGGRLRMLSLQRTLMSISEQGIEKASKEIGNIMYSKSFKWYGEDLLSDYE